MMDCWFSEVTKIVGPPLLTQQAHSWVATVDGHSRVLVLCRGPRIEPCGTPPPSLKHTITHVAQG